MAIVRAHFRSKTTPAHLPKVMRTIILKNVLNIQIGCVLVHHWHWCIHETQTQISTWIIKVLMKRAFVVRKEYVRKKLELLLRKMMVTAHNAQEMCRTMTKLIEGWQPHKTMQIDTRITVKSTKPTIPWKKRHRAPGNKHKNLLKHMQRSKTNLTPSKLTLITRGSGPYINPH